MAALHGVDEQEKFLLIAQTAQAEEVFRGRGGDAAFALYAFNQYGGGGGGKGFARRIEIVEGNMPEAGDQRLETFLHFLLTGGGDAGEGAPVKGVVSGEDLEAAFVVAEFAREFVQALVGFRAGVAEEDLAGRKMLYDALGEPALWFVVIEIGDVQEFLGLFREGGGDFRMRMAEGAHGDAAAEVEVAPAIHIPDVAAGTAGEREIEARVGGQDVFREEFADGLELIPHDGRRRRKRGDDFFHLSRASLSHKARRVQTKNSFQFKTTAQVFGHAAVHRTALISNPQHRLVHCPRWLLLATGVALLMAGTIFACFTVFSRLMSPDEGYLMITVQSFLGGHGLYDTVFTQYGPFYYAYEWLLHAVLRLPLTHDATRLACVFHWMLAAALLGLAVRRATKSSLAGAVMFMAAVVHLARIADEPGHPQEVVVLLLALAVLAISGGAGKSGRFLALGILGAALAFTKINAGIFFVAGMFLTIWCEAPARWTRGALHWLIVGASACLPVLLMREHLGLEWCRNYCVVAVVGIVAAQIVSRRNAMQREVDWKAFAQVGLGLLLGSLVCLVVAFCTGSSLRGVVDGLLLTPMKMSGVALLPLPVPNGSLVNAGVSLFLAMAAKSWLRSEPGRRWLIGLKGVFGVLGGLWLAGDANAEIVWLLPWVWLVVMEPAPQVDEVGRRSLWRTFLCLGAVWQSLQAYPIAGTQMTIATLLLVVACVICLADAAQALVAQEWLTRRLDSFSPRRVALMQAFSALFLLTVFINGWCKLPEVRREYDRLIPLGLPGSRLVRMDAETVGMYRALSEYLDRHCDAFVTYPGINSLYLWTGKLPPTHINSTGWGQLSHAQQNTILGSLKKSSRPLLVVVEAAVRSWGSPGPEAIKPLIRFVREDCRPVVRLGRFVIFEPRKTRPLPPAESETDDRSMTLVDPLSRP